MKNIQMLAVLGLIFALSGIARAETYVRPAAITIVGIQGEARYSVDGNAWHPLVVGKILRAGAVIETAAGSSCDLVLSGSPVALPENTSAPQSMSMMSIAPDPNIRGYVAYKPMAQQNVIRMSGGTMLAVDKLSVIDTGADTVGDTELDLRAGKIFTSVKKLSASSQYIIKLPNGVAGIRGSSGSLGADGSAEWVVGTIVISVIVNGQPHVVVVHGGFKYDPQTGQVEQVSPQVLEQLIQQIAAIVTTYRQIHSLSIDITEVYISPTQGKIAGDGDGGNNNNDNNDDNDDDGVVVASP